MIGKTEIIHDLESVSDRTDVPDDVKKTLRTLTDRITTPLDTDAWIYRLVVVFLGLVILVTVCGGIFLGTGEESQLPEGIVAIGSAAVGALAGLLAPSPRSG